MASHKLDRLLRPKTIAVFGGLQAAEVIKQSQKMGFSGEIWPVHPKHDEICGLKVYRSVADLPGSPDAAFVGVNRFLTLDIVRDLREAGAGVAVCYASGFLEAGADDADGARLQEELVEAAGDMPIIGPNCYGLINYCDGALLWPDQHGGRRLGPDERGVAIITQSSNIAINMTMQTRGLPIAHVMTAGNQAQTGLPDMAIALLEDERVTALGLHIEAFQSAAKIRASSQTRPRTRQAYSRDESRPFRTGAGGDRLAHGFAGGIGCGIGRVSQAARHSPRQLDCLLP